MASLEEERLLLVQWHERGIEIPERGTHQLQSMPLLASQLLIP